jgi:hypothetical protein
VLIVETFATKKLTENVSVKFRHKYPDSPVPTKSCVSKLVKKWRSTGFSVWHKEALEEYFADRRKGRDIEARLQISPRKSLRLLAQETGVSLGSAVSALMTHSAIGSYSRNLWEMFVSALSCCQVSSIIERPVHCTTVILFLLFAFIFTALVLCLLFLR